MKRLVLMFTVSTLGLVAACESDERTAQEEVSIAAQEDPGFTSEAPTAVVPVPDTAGGRTLTGNLADMGNSGASGVVTLTPRNGQTLIQLSVTGVQPGMRLQPTVHRGRCGDAGELAHRLEVIEAAPTGAALADVFVGGPVESVADGAHSVRIYAEAGFDGQVPALACADIPTTAAGTRM